MLLRQRWAIEPGVNATNSTGAIEKYRGRKGGEVGELRQRGRGGLGVVGSRPQQDERNVVGVPVKPNLVIIRGAVAAYFVSQPDDLQPASVVVLIELYQGGCRIMAGWAPGPEHVDHDHLVLEPRVCLGDLAPLQ